MKITLKRAMLALTGLAIGGMAFAWAGLINVSASSGHWAVTDWFLHWVMRNSVSTYSSVSAVERPLDKTGMVSAAGLYAASCEACHGGPGVAPLPVMQAATPPAPDLAHNAPEWSDQQLFWIVKHGVKFTGMPGWAAQDRDDEVRRMAGFVRALPTMSPETYRALVMRPVAGAADPLVAGCTGCHGTDGRGRGSADIPVLGGQHPAALAYAIDGYATGRRQSAVMANAVARLSAADRRRLSLAFAAMPGLPAQPSANRGDDAIAAIAMRGQADLDLPACDSCHGGKADAKAPRIAGQKAVYLAGRLRQWRGDETIVDARKPQDTMAKIARRIPEKLIEPLARHYEQRGR